MNLLLILVLIGGGYLALRSSQTGIPIAQQLSDVLGGGAGGVSLGAVSFTPFGPNSDPRNWYNGMKPGSVIIGGQKAPAGWNPTGDNLAGSASKAGRTTGTIVGSVSAIGTTGIFGTSGLSVAIGGALPIVGAALVAVVTILSIIGAHHQAAVAAEGKALNDADPRSANAMVMVLQGILTGQISSIASAQQMLAQIVADWYGEVKNIQKGTWHYTLTPAQDPSLMGDVTGQGDTTSGDLNWFGANIAGDSRPGVCNGPCVVGHYFVERNAAVVLLTIQAALAGNHGVMTFPALPPHDASTGFPPIEVTY